MNQDVALRVLSQIMAWDDDEARREFAWLRMMARFKYDGYRDFLAGGRFIENLANWLQQFAMEDRRTAYAFVRTQLVYIGPSEIQRLVEQFYPRTVQERLLCRVAKHRGIKKYEVWADPAAKADFERLRRRVLFMALSDGARLDVLRHANAGVLNNEQFVVATQIDKDKWSDLVKDLRKDQDDPDARFEIVYLVDDFMGTGSTFLRYDAEKLKWAGKLMRFRESARWEAFAENWELCVHHHIAASTGKAAVAAWDAKARTELGEDAFFSHITYSYGMVLQHDLRVDADQARNAGIIDLTQRYYDEHVQSRHTDVGGKKHLGLGYGGCALPVVLEHNTPNNSISLLWAETDGLPQSDGSAGHAMRPLFRRRQRHV